MNRPALVKHTMTARRIRPWWSYHCQQWYHTSMYKEDAKEDPRIFTGPLAPDDRICIWLQAKLPRRTPPEDSRRELVSHVMSLVSHVMQWQDHPNLNILKDVSSKRQHQVWSTRKLRKKSRKKHCHFTGRSKLAETLRRWIRSKNTENRSPRIVRRHELGMWIRES